MGIETKYSCDKCGHSQPTASQMWHICIGYGSLESNHAPAYYETHQQMWCRNCMENQGILRGDNNPKEKIPSEPSPTLDDILRQIMREEISNMTGAC